VTGLSIYETVVILSPDLDEAGVNAHVEKYKTTVSELGGTVETIDLWGRRRLEYEIDRKREGIYYVMMYRVSTENNPTARLDRNLRFDEQVLRYLTIRRDDLVKTRAKKMRARREAKKAKAEARQAEIQAQRAAAAEAASANAIAIAMTDDGDDDLSEN